MINILCPFKFMMAVPILDLHLRWFIYVNYISMALFLENFGYDKNNQIKS
jgi:hypothetical protein